MPLAPGNLSSYNLAPGSELGPVDYRKKVAAQLLLQGSSAEPVQHWTQGAARIAQALSGGYELNQINKEEEAEKKTGREIMAQMLGGGTAQPAASPPSPTQPTRVAAALSGAPPQAPAAPAGPSTAQGSMFGGMPGWAPGERPIDSPAQPGVPGGQPPMAGMTPAGATPVQTQATQPPAVAPSMSAQMRGGMSPEQSQRLLVGLQNKYSAPLAQQMLLTEQKKAQDAVRTLSLEEMKTVPGWKEGDPALQVDSTGKKSPIDNRQNISINSVANPVLEGVGKSITEGRNRAYSAAREVIPALHDARRAIDEGATTGAFSTPRIFAQKVAGLFGIPAEQASNSEVFKAAVGNVMAGNIKKLGTNPSNADVRIMTDILGGSAELEEKSVRKLLDIQEKYARIAIRNHNEDIKKLVAAEPNTYRGIAGVLTAEEPPEYQVPPPKQSNPKALRELYGLE